MDKMMSKSERTRQFIVEKTAPIFNIKGYSGTSINDLMSATGLSKGSIYGNFENKDEVAIAAFEHNFNKIITLLSEKVLERKNAVERLLVFPKVYRNFVEFPILQGGCPLINAAVEADDTHPILKEKVAQSFVFLREMVEQQVKRGIKREEIKADTNPTEIAVIIISTIEGAIIQAKVTGRTTELKIAMNFLEKIITKLGK